MSVGAGYVGWGWRESGDEGGAQGDMIAESDMIPCCERWPILNSIQNAIALTNSPCLEHLLHIEYIEGIKCIALQWYYPLEVWRSAANLYPFLCCPSYSRDGPLLLRQISTGSETMANDLKWEKKKLLIVVKTYPTPANRGVEVSCTAAITEQSEWIRLFPVPYRFLDGEKRFQKYQWIEASIRRSRDHRPESFQIDADSINILSDPISSKDSWKARREVLEAMRSQCLCCLKEEQISNKFPTLGFFKPGEISGLSLEAVEPHWTESELAKLNQLGMFDGNPHKTLEKIPYTFYYTFRCAHDHCGGHRMSCTDWEMGQAYRNFRDSYGLDWQSKFMEKFDQGIRMKSDTHFFVGTVSNHPNSWIIVGLFYPPQMKGGTNNDVAQLSLL